MGVDRTPPRERRAKEAKPNFVVRAWRSLKRRAGHVAQAATEPLPRGRPPFDTWNEAKRKHNVLVTATLREKGGDAFCVLFVGRPNGNGLAKGKRCGSARRRV